MTFLQHLGSFFKKVLGIATTVAVAVEPEIDIAFPAIAPLYNSTLGLAITAETASTTAKSGPQKLQQLVTNLLPQAQAWATQNGIVWPEADIQKWASAVVDTMNLIPGPTLTPKPATPTVPAS